MPARLLPLLLLLLPAVAWGAGEEIEQVSFGFKFTPALIVLGTFALYLLVGFFSRVSSPSDYWVAGRGVGKFGNGAAIASDWMSAASFMGVAGLLYLKGWFGLGYILGWTGGYVLLLCLLAAQLRRFGKFTVPEFLGDRYDSHGVRLAAAAVTVVIAVTYAVAQFKGMGLVCGWIFGMDYRHSVILAAGITLAYMLVSGMTGVTRNQQLQYVILITAFAVPLWVLMRKSGGSGLFPPLEYGRLLSGVMDGRTAGGQLEGEALAEVRRIFLPWGSGGDIYSFLALVFTLMVGTAGLPHIMVRFYTARSEETARRSVLWGLFFIGLLYWASPVYAVMGRFWNPRGGQEVADMIILSAPELADLGQVFLGYLAAGALAAGISTVASLLMTAASAVAHDWYSTVLHPHCSEKEQLLIARVFTGIVCVFVVVIALNPPALIAQIVAMAFAVAGTTIFPACVLAVWDSGSNRYGALAGMVFGLVMTLIAMFGWIARIPLFGDGGLLSATSSALIICPLAFLINIAVSRLTAEKVAAATFDHSDVILRRLHNLPARAAADEAP